MKIRFPLILDIPKRLLILADFEWITIEGDGWGGDIVKPRVLSIGFSGWWFSREADEDFMGRWKMFLWRIGFLSLEFFRVDYVVPDGWSPGVTITEREMP